MARQQRDPARSAPAVGHHHVPVAAGPLLGRETLFAAVEADLQRPGLITLTGTGGAGKTRLAAELALRARSSRATVWWVDLRSARTLSDFEREVAWAIGGPRTLPEPTIRLADQPGALLVLDNLEQLPREVTARIERWLAAAPELRVLGTTRGPLGSKAERRHAVPPLPVPDAAGAFEGPAWALLVHHAPEGALAGASPDDVVRLIRAVDGLPLAIQLAAGRLEVMSLSLLAQRLDRVLDLVAAPSSREERHGSLRSVAASTWRLLSDVERATLIQLSVFRGRFSLAAAEEVSDLSGSDVLDAIHNLVRRHLLVREGSCFGMLEVMRAYAVDRRREDGHDAGLLERHARWVCSSTEARLPDTIDETWLSGALLLLPEAYAVLERAEQGLVDPALAHDCWMFGLTLSVHQGALVESASVAARLLELPGATDGQRAWQHVVHCRPKRYTGDLADARAELSLAERLAREAGDPFTLVEILLARAFLLSEEGEHGAARPLLVQAERQATDIGAWRAVVRCKLQHSVGLGFEAGWPSDRGDPRHQEILGLTRDAIAMADGRDAALALLAQLLYAGHLARMAVTREAYEAYLSVREVARELGATDRLAEIEGGLGNTAEILGDLEAAERHLDVAWRRFEQRGAARNAAYYRGFHGRLLVRLGRDEEGIRELRTVLDAREQLGGGPYFWSQIQRCLDLATAYDPTTWDRETDDEGLRLLREAQRAHAAGTVPEVRRRLGELDALPPPRFPADLLRLDLVERLRTRIESWSIATDGTRFRPPGEDWCSPGTNPANARILAHLAARRRAVAGSPCPADELFEAGWPEERAVAQSRQNRVRVALSQLREAGLRPLLRRVGRRGWLLDPDVPLAPNGEG